MSKRGGDPTRTHVTKVKKRKGVGSRTINIPDSDEEDLPPTPSNDYARVMKTRVGIAGKVERIATSNVPIFETDQLPLLEDNAEDRVDAIVEDVLPAVPAKQRKKANDSVSFQPHNPSALLTYLQTKMYSWIKVQLDVLDEIASLDGPGVQQLDLCSSCPNRQISPIYRCLECPYPSLHCSECIMKRHNTLPLHRIEVRSFRQNAKSGSRST